MIHIKRIDEMADNQPLYQIEDCDVLRVGMGSYTFDCRVDGGDYESLVETDRDVYGKVSQHFKGDCDVEIVWDIDLWSGNIIGWNGGTMEVNFKVVDTGEYELVRDGVVVSRVVNEYVPKFLQIDEDGWNDYVTITIDEKGHINKWDRSRASQVYAFFRKYGKPVGMNESAMHGRVSSTDIAKAQRILNSAAGKTYTKEELFNNPDVMRSFCDEVSAIQTMKEAQGIECDNKIIPPVDEIDKFFSRSGMRKLAMWWDIAPMFTICRSSVPTFADMSALAKRYGIEDAVTEDSGFGLTSISFTDLELSPEEIDALMTNIRKVATSAR